MKKTKKNSVWGTRMQSEVSSVLQAANSSIEIDKKIISRRYSRIYCSLHHVGKKKNY